MFREFNFNYILVILAICILILASSCNEQYKTVKTEEKWAQKEYKVVTIEKCEYLIKGDGITHKGNCKNTIYYK